MVTYPIYFQNGSQGTMHNSHRFSLHRTHANGAIGNNALGVV